MAQHLRRALDSGRPSQSSCGHDAQSGRSPSRCGHSYPRSPRQRGFHTSFFQQWFIAQESLIFTNHHFWYSIQQDRTGTHWTRRQGGVQDAFPVNRGELSTGILKGIHFSMQYDASFLDSPVMTFAKDSVIVYDDRSDRYSTLRKSLFCLVNCRCQEYVHFFLQ